MKCPACTQSLKPMEAGGVTVDVCRDGCGGLWLDNFELQKFDEPHEHEGIPLLDFKIHVNTAVRTDSKRPCPVCDAIKLRRHFFGSRKEIEIDSCGGCGGVWLDAGELRAIRNQCRDREQGSQSRQELVQAVNAAHHPEIFCGKSPQCDGPEADQISESRVAHLIDFLY